MLIRDRAELCPASALEPDAHLKNMGAITDRLIYPSLHSPNLRRAFVTHLHHAKAWLNTETNWSPPVLSLLHRWITAWAVMDVFLRSAREQHPALGTFESTHRVQLSLAIQHHGGESATFFVGVVARIGQVEVRHHLRLTGQTAVDVRAHRGSPARRYARKLSVGPKAAFGTMLSTLSGPANNTVPSAVVIAETRSPTTNGES